MFKIFALCMTLVFTGVTLAVQENYPSLRRAATALVHAGEHAKALEAFEQLVNEATTPLQRSDALEQAALCAQRLKMNDKAVELAKQIPLVPESTTLQMLLLLDNKQAQQLVDDYQNQTMDDWSREKAGEACFYRGQAYVSLNMTDKAAQDLQFAVDNLPRGKSQSHALVMLGDLNKTKLNNPDKAIELYTQAIELERKRAQWEWLCFTAKINCAATLTQQKKFDQALQILTQDDLGDSKGHWQVAMRCAQGDVHAAKGDLDQARELYQQALDHAAADYQKAMAQRKLDALSSPAT